MKVYVIYVLLTITICIVIYFINKKETTIIEEKGDPVKNFFNKMGKDTKKGFDKVGKETKKGFDKAGNAMKNGLNQLGNQITNTFKSLIQPILDFINCAKLAFESIIGYLKCGFDKVVQFPFCFIFYFFDCIYGLIYVIFLIVAGIIPALKEPVDMIFNPKKGYIQQLKNLINDFAKEGTGDTILYPGFIMKRCYLCDVKPFPNFSNPKMCGKKQKDKGIKVPVKYITEEEIQKEEEESDKDQFMTSALNVIFIIIVVFTISAIFYVYVDPRDLINQKKIKESVNAVQTASSAVTKVATNANTENLSLNLPKIGGKINEEENELDETKIREISSLIENNISEKIKNITSYFSFATE